MLSALFQALAGLDEVAGCPAVDIVDVEQVVIRGQLVLGVELALHVPAESVAACLEAVRARTGTTITVAAGPDHDSAAYHAQRRGRHHVIALGRPLGAPAVAAVAESVAAMGANIDAIRRLSDYPVTALELVVSGASSAPLRTELAGVARALGIDVAVERIGLDRRAKRLVVMDVDSTLVQGEVIDLLAERAGVAAEVAAITERAMAGELDFAQSLAQRVAMLEGLPVAAVDDVRAALRLTPGARTLIRTLRRLGMRVGIVSGGFSLVTDPLAAELGLDFARANTLEVRDGALTGRTVGPVVDRAGKAAALRAFAAESGVPMSQTVAVGDGANDLDMLAAAGLGIAFNAKPVVRSQTDAALNQPFLDAILFFLGVSRDELLDD